MVFPGIVCLTMAGIADLFFYQHPAFPGITIGVFILLLLAFLVMRFNRILNQTPARWVCGGTGGLVLACFYEPSSLSVLLSAMGLVSLSMMSYCSWNGDYFLWGMNQISFFFTALWRIFLDFILINRLTHLNRLTHHSNFFSKTLLPWIIPLVLTTIFLILFAFANPIIENLGDSCFKYIEEVLSVVISMISIARLFFWCSVIVILWPLFRPFKKGFFQKSFLDGDIKEIPEKNGSTSVEPENNDLISNIFGDGLVYRSLILFNVLFLFQNSLDLFFLWGGGQLPSGMTYAQYAHRGAYPLVFTALLAAFFVLSMFRQEATNQKAGYIRKLIYIWLGQNIFLTFSAAWRLDLYIEVYSLTRLRLAAIIWMGLVAIGLVSIIYRIVRNKTQKWLVNFNSLALLTVLYVSCFWNTDGFIANYNVNHSRLYVQNGIQIDLDYIKDLGIKALPAVEKVLCNSRDRQEIEIAKQLVFQFRRDLQKQTENWRSWTILRWKLLMLYSENNSGENPDSVSQKK